MVWRGLLCLTPALALSKLRIHDRCCGALEEGVVIVPLGLEFLLLKASIFIEVSQVGKGLPDDQEEDTNQYNAGHSAPYDGSHVGAFHTLSIVVHMDVVSVSVLLLQSVSYPAALRVSLLAGLFLERGSLQRHIGTLNTTILLKGALIKFQALGTEDVGAAGQGAAGTLFTQRWLVTFLTDASVALAPATATALHQPCVQTARGGPLTLASRALETLLAITLATGAGASLWATADLAIISLTVEVVTLAVLPKDHFVGDVTRVAHALPADAVPQPRAHNGTIVLPAVPLQLLAAPALRLTLTVFPNVARLTPADATLHDSLASTEIPHPTLVPALALALGMDLYRHCVGEAQCPDDKGLLLDTLRSRDLYLEGDRVVDLHTVTVPSGFAYTRYSVTTEGVIGDFQGVRDGGVVQEDSRGEFIVGILDKLDYVTGVVRQLTHR